MHTLGPIMTSTTFWTGFLLLVRSILFFIFAFNTFGGPRLNVLVITLAALSLSMLFGVLHPVYKKRYCNILEFSFYINLGAVSVATLYVSTNNGNQAAVMYTSTGVALLTFAGTVFCRVYQGTTCQSALHVAWQHVRSGLLKWKDIRAGSEEPLLHNAGSECELNEDQVPQSMRPVLHFDQYREPVLEYEDN